MSHTRLTRLSIFLLLAAMLLAPLTVAAQEVATDTYTARDGTVAFDYPEGWLVISQAELYFLITNDTQLQMDSTAIEPGEVRVTLLLYPASSLPDVQAGASPAELLEAFATRDNVDYADPVEFEVGSRPAIRASVPTDDPDLEETFIIFPIGSGIISTFNVQTAPGELGDFLPQVTAIARSLTFTFPEPTPIPRTVFQPIYLDQSYTSQDGSVTLNYPEPWVVQEQDDTIYIASDEQAADPESLVQSGQFQISLDVVPLDTISDLPPNPTPLDAITAAINSFTDTSQFSQPVELTLGGRSAVRVDSLMSQDADHSVIFVFLSDETLGAIAARAALGEMEDFETTLMGIAASVRLTTIPSEAYTPPTSSVALTQTHRSGDVRFNYPDGWIVQEESGLFLLASSADVDPNSMVSGDAVALLGMVEGNDSATSALESLRQQSGDQVNYDDPVEFTLGERPAARMVTPQLGEHSVIAVVLDGQSVAYVSIFAAPDELAQVESLMLGVLDSLAVGAPVEETTTPATPAPTPSSGDAESVVSVDTDTLTRSFHSSDGRIEFSFPTQWAAQERQGIIVLGNSKQVVEESFDAGAGTGDVLVVVDVVLSEDVASLGANVSPHAVLLDFLASSTALESSFNTPEGFTLDGRRAARTQGLTGDSAIITVELEDSTFGMMFVFTAEGEFADFEPTLYAIASTIRYTG